MVTSADVASASRCWSPSSTCRVGSLRWWFENRETGEITVGQFPNWPLWGIGVSWIVTAVVHDGALRTAAGWAADGLWLYWAADEIVRGVNPWRRVLGCAVIAWRLFLLTL